jgi:MoaA/NifB/PqqE/SkfB family radical SAM enzyme
MSLAQKFLKKIPQYTRSYRHAWSVVRHGNPRKWSNLAQVEWDRKRRRIEVKGHPYLLIIDPCNYCNLRCPLCPTGVNELGRPQAMLSFEHFKKYFDPLSPYIFEAYMHNWGESMLNKQVFKMIDYAQQHNVGTNLSSNFAKTTSADIDSLLDSGLEYLIVSLDGTSEETYVQYRVGGHYQQVIDNMAELLRRRQVRRLKKPVVEWQFIVMKQNEHQTDEAERLAARMGVDVMRFIPVGLPFEAENRTELAAKWYPTKTEGRVQTAAVEQQYGQGDKPSPCFYLYRSMVVNPDGGVSPCCILYKKHRDFATLNTDDLNIMKIWNNDKYRSARSLFSPEVLDKPRATVCDVCDIFQHHESKARKPAPSNLIAISAAATEVSKLAAVHERPVNAGGE